MPKQMPKVNTGGSSGSTYSGSFDTYEYLNTLNDKLVEAELKAREKVHNKIIADREKEADAELDKKTEIYKELEKRNKLFTQADYDNQIAKAKDLASKKANERIIADRDATEKLYRVALEDAKKLDAASRQLAEDKAKKEHDLRMQQIDDEAAGKLQAAMDAAEEAIKYELDLRLSESKKLEKKLTKKKEKEQSKQKYKTDKQALEGTLFGKDVSLTDKLKGLKEAFTTTTKTGDTGADVTNSLMKGFSTLTGAIGDMAKKLDSDIDKIAKRQSSIDTRLQGSKNETEKTNFGGQSYWNKMSKDITALAGVSPLIKQEDIVENISSMVDKGIAFNVEQRAFLATISDKIATTFEATDGTLLKLIRLQQADSTAARLGMESAITAFLNNMYENTEYLKGVAESVRSSLYEAEALMTDTAAVELEYQMQKWLGSLYSVGMSQGAVEGIAGSFGKLASGDITSLTDGKFGNLIIMAANKSGISLSDALAKGLDATQTNNLMNATVSYLSSIYNESKDSKVLQQQMANIYGLTASDLKAAANLASDNNKTIKSITNTNVTYNDTINQLTAMANSMYQRTSIGELLENASNNLTYTMAAGIANNPALYMVYKTAGLLDAFAGGGEFSIPMVLGTGTAQTFSTADILRTTALIGGAVSGLAGMLTSASGGGGLSGTEMLKAMGINGTAQTVSRGSGTGLTKSGMTVSESGSTTQFNSDQNSMNDKIMGDQSSQTQEQVQAAKSEDEGPDIATLDNRLVSIYNLLSNVADGTASFTVQMKDYGLSWQK